MIILDLGYKVEIILKFTWMSHWKEKRKKTVNRNLFGPLSFWAILNCFSDVIKLCAYRKNQLEFCVSLYLTVSSLWHIIINEMLRHSIEFTHIFLKIRLLMDFRMTGCYTSCWFGKLGNLLILCVPIFYWVVNPFIKQNVFQWEERKQYKYL